MERKIHIFQSYEEQEAFHIEMENNTSINERFRKLYEMQQMSLALIPPREEDKKRRIIIKHGFTKS